MKKHTVSRPRGKLYDHAWAAATEMTFEISCTRAGNFLRVFAQLVSNLGVPVTYQDIRELIIERLRYSNGQETWKQFKRIAKSDILASDVIVKRFAEHLAHLLHARVVEKEQLPLEF